MVAKILSKKLFVTWNPRQRHAQIQYNQISAHKHHALKYSTLVPCHAVASTYFGGAPQHALDLRIPIYICEMDIRKRLEEITALE
jgi:hypothetical protein